MIEDFLNLKLKISAKSLSHVVSPQTLAVKKSIGTARPGNNISKAFGEISKTDNVKTSYS